MERRVSQHGLTILLTTKGRHLFTLRWLWHANKVRLPFPVIVADGEVHPTIEQLISDQGIFPNLNITHLRYRDLSYLDFYAKLSDSLGRVKTTYVMLSDNDDFLFIDGIKESIEFLDNNPEYVCAGGGVPGFSVHPAPAHTTLYGGIGRIFYRYNTTYINRDIDHPSLRSRVFGQIENHHPVYYNIYRSDELRKVIREVEICKFSDLHMFEYYCACRVVTLGRVRSTPALLTYFRQHGTSQRTLYNALDDLFLGNFGRDVRLFSEELSQRIILSEGGDADQIYNDIFDKYRAFVLENLSNFLFAVQLKKRKLQILIYIVNFRDTLMSVLLSLLRKVLPISVISSLSQSYLLNRLANDGATKSHLNATRMELRDIELTLSNQEFMKFVEEKAPILMDTEGARLK